MLALTCKRWVVKITSGKVVSIEFQISDANGTILDQSDEGNEWTFLTGTGEIPVGLEVALEGKAVGDAFKVVLTPENGYGERDEELVQVIPKTDLGDEDVELSVGDQLEAESDDGESWHTVTVVAIADDTITVDGNHEFAGKTVSFDVKITEVRDATPEELEHGHVHDGECEDEEWDEEWDEDDEEVGEGEFDDDDDDLDDDELDEEEEAK
jgi:FKBP-type peptidyl-prolyl cis-trans isomerase SlyD